MPSESDSDPKVNSSSSFSAWWAKCRPFSGSLSRGDRTQPFVDKESSRKPAEGIRTLIKRASRAHIQSTQKPTPYKACSDHEGAELQETSHASPKMTDLKERLKGLTGFINDLTELDNTNYESSHEAYKTNQDKLVLSDIEPPWDKAARLSTAKNEQAAVEKLRTDEEKKAAKQAAKQAAENERAAAEIIYKIREFERSSPGGPFANLPGEAIPPEESRDMGGRFLANKKRIDESSKLFDIAKMMPKGALLHLHMNAQLDAREVIQRVLCEGKQVEKTRLSLQHMAIGSKIPLLKREDFDITEIQFQVNPSRILREKNMQIAVAPEANVFKEGYAGFPDASKPGGDAWMSWGNFLKEYSKSKANLNLELEADEWVLSKMVSNPNMIHRPEGTVNDVWARFNQSTRAFKGLVSEETAFGWYIEELIKSLSDDNIMYAELRPMWLGGEKAMAKLDDAKFNGEDEIYLTIEDQIEIIQEKVEAKQKDQKKKLGSGYLPFDLKVIYCTPRSISRDLMRSEINKCIDLKRQYPDMICGFDLVGAEDRTNNIGYYGAQLKEMEEKCHKIELELNKECKEGDERLEFSIPFMFHAGETLLDMGGTNDPSHSNLYDAVELGAKRIGHGFALPRHSPEFIRRFKDANICIELCPISNELLHLCRNVKEHPFPQILQARIPCTLNSDNPSLFTNSLSYEFYQAMVGWPQMTLFGWKQFVLWSIEYSCMSAKQKEDAEGFFTKQWDVFCGQVVKDYKDKEGCSKDPAEVAKYGIYDKLPKEKDTGKPKHFPIPKVPRHILCGVPVEAKA